MDKRKAVQDPVCRNTKAVAAFATQVQSIALVLLWSPLQKTRGYPPFGVSSQRGKQHVFTERVLVPRPAFFRLSCWCVCLFFVAGRFVLERIHTTHPSVERLCSDDALVVANLVKAIFRSWVFSMLARGDLQRLVSQSWFPCVSADCPGIIFFACQNTN